MTAWFSNNCPLKSDENLKKKGVTHLTSLQKYLYIYYFSA